MNSVKDRFKPSIDKKILPVIAGTIWSGVGIMLVAMAVHWLSGYKGNPWLFGITGFVAALIIHHFGFLKIVDKNLGRISRLPGKPCVFSFISWKSYVLIFVMVNLGIILRHSSIQKQYLSIIYLGIGLALFLSSIRYFRSLFVNI